MLPNLNNQSFWETTFGSNKIKEQHETRKLQNEKGSPKTLKTLINELDE